MPSIQPGEVSVAKFHGLLLGAVAPRPIALASTLNPDGSPNLSPFSFFNVFSANPPIAIFSPARRVRDNTTKHTLENVLHTPEVVINIVNYSMVQQTSLSSTEYAQGVNEFVKSGLKPVTSTLVKPPGVMEAPARLECKVKEVISLGDQGGAGNLIVCEILMIHVKDELLNEAGGIDPRKIDLVARMGGDWYCRANGDALFEVPKPLTTLGMGVDQLPESIRNSTILSGNDLGKLGNVERLPDANAVQAFEGSEDFNNLLKAFPDEEKNSLNLHRMAAELLKSNNVQDAWKVLLISKVK